MKARGDYNLLKFETYADYLKSYTRIEEYRYLNNTKVINDLVKLGYRTNAIIYEEDDFYKNKNLMVELLNPKSVSSKLFSSYLASDDPVLVALAKREEANMNKKLSTIIFLQIRQRSGFDISGYIDYASSLRACSQQVNGATNWKAVFQGRLLLRPNRSNLSFYDWHSGTTSFNNSDNYEVLHYGSSLMFKHTGDHKIISLTASEHRPNPNRTSIISPLYGSVVLYDHLVRKAT